MLAVGEQATVTDRGVRRVDPGHTRTVCSGYHRGPFFHVSSESSHNTSKVTKAKGKQIRGRALTGLSNTRAARRWSLHTTLLKVTTKKRREISRGRRPTPPQRASTYVDVPLRHLPGRARLSVPAYPRFRSFATERGEKFTALNHTRETKLIGGGVKRTKEESNKCQGKPSFLLSTTAVLDPCTPSNPRTLRFHALSLASRQSSPRRSRSPVYIRYFRTIRTLFPSFSLLFFHTRYARNILLREFS